MRKNPIQHALAAWLASCALAWPAAAAHAGAYTISPVLIELTPQNPIAALTVSNDASQPLILEASARGWTQRDGKDRLEPTHDLIITPPLFSIPAHATQVVRIGLRVAPGLQGERAYRLLLNEIVTRGGAARHTANVQMVLQTNIPVFAAAPGLAPPELHWKGWRVGKSVALDVRNAGGTHVEITGLRVKAGTDKLLDSPMALYLLPGGTRRIEVPAGPNGAPTGTELNIDAQLDAKAPADHVAARVPLAEP